MLTGRYDCVERKRLRCGMKDEFKKQAGSMGSDRGSISGTHTSAPAPICTDDYIGCNKAP